MTAGIVAAHYVAGGTPGAGYAAAVLADSPWGFWEHTETTGTTLVDASTNARNMTLTTTAGAVTFNQTGPAASMSAILWPTGDNTYGNTAVGFASATGTCELWFYLSANPSVVLALGACQNNGSGSLTKFLQIDTAGKPSFGLTLATMATSASAVTLNSWNHLVGSVGAAGTKLRLNKVTVATLANTTSSSSSLAAALHRKQGAGATSPGAVSTAAMAVWASQLSDAQTDAHYDAMFA